MSLTRYTYTVSQNGQLLLDRNACTVCKDMRLAIVADIPWSAGHSHKLCQNGLTDRDAV